MITVPTILNQKTTSIHQQRTATREIAEEYYPEEDVKQIAHEVLEELKRRDLDKTKES